MINDVEHLFMYMLTICVSVGKCLFKFFGRFLIGLFIYMLLGYMSFLYVLGINTKTQGVFYCEFSPRSFMISLKFKPLIHCEFMFVSFVR